MPRAKTSKAARPAKSKTRLPLLQHRLILQKYLLNQLGVASFTSLKEKLQDQKEGWAEDGQSYYFRVLEGIEGLRIPLDRLADYDLRIRQYVDRLNHARPRPVQLKYFQYIAVLLAEIILDRLFTDEKRFVRELDRLVSEENARLSPAEIRYTNFTSGDLSKIAFWMATGSGKTLVMHINLWQYLHYSKGATEHDNVLLVTPNEGLSRQHIEEMRLSGIAASHYGGTEQLLPLAGHTPVTVIEITKLTETKRGGGLSVEVDAFGANNLLLVDEGHRGASGETWRELRRRLAEKGFTFEYSATFGQIVNGASREKRPPLLEEYSKAILFDYSYPHFYDDGFGKDYWITNLKDESGDFNDVMLLGNLLAFYQQLVVYEENKEAFRPYNLEKPLWVFVGHTVTGGRGSQDDKASLTDVEQIIRFLDRFLADQTGWTKRIEKVLKGRSGLKNRRDEDIFEGLFAYLSASGQSATSIYRDVVRKVLNGSPGEAIRAVEMRGATGEIGLRVGAESPYFGVINIGDVAGLTKRLQAIGVACEEDSITGSLFGPINEPGSRVNVLIGSRKFMEGWDSFRVANMGLMNIGRGEGPQIIQLFGRGVRLWGRDYSLKRSTALEPNGAPASIRMIETLTVFGVRANYMEQFRRYLTEEGIETEYEELHLPTKIEKAFLARGLQVPRLPDGKRYQDVAASVLVANDEISVALDLRPRMEVARSGSGNGDESEKAVARDYAAEIRGLAQLLDWQKIYFEVESFARAKGYSNLAVTPESLRGIIEHGKYEILLPDTGPLLSEPGQLRRLKQLATSALKKYVTASFDRSRREWEQQNLQLRPIGGRDENLNFGSYTLRLRASNRDFVKEVRKLIKQATTIYEKDLATFPNIHFDRHLYQPLVASDKKDRFRSAPPALNEGEAAFVRDLRDELQNNKAAYQGREVFLLRNLTRGRGIGFFDSGEGESFYPDFILWIIEGKEQWIAFIDPHGLRHARGGFSDPKIQMCERLKELQTNLQAQTKKWKIHLTSVILSTSRYDDLAKTFGAGGHPQQDFEDNGIFFQEDASYPRKLLERVTSDIIDS